jgi:arabinofuranosyltransferase
VRTYFFLTDDSFISFRYARNLVHGHGLVFNPGGERVEGYTNLLWVLLLAGFALVGLRMEHMASVLSVAATFALFGLVVRFAWVRLPAGRKWIATIPALFLASTRGFAVWATSGLETRLFDFLLVAGLLRLVHEVEDMRPDGTPPRALAPWIFGLAALTRPDGLLVGGCAFLAAFAYRRWTSGRTPWREALAWWPMAALVLGHLAFRRAYYGDWVPNTFYAKVGARHSLGAGLRYLALFALEYGVVLWIPGLVAGVAAHARKRTLFMPALFLAAVVPHVLYVALIGGDHFEFRPLDFYWPLVFLLIADGVRSLATSPGRARLAGVYAALVLFGLVWFPLRSHREYPKQYWPGFPGTYPGLLEDADRFLAPETDPVFRLPILRTVAGAYRDLMREQTAHFGAVRQEEHRMFREGAETAARRLNAVLDRGALPRDLYVAVDCVGVVPYRTDLRTLDRLGLTDAHVAHGPFLRDVVAHGKYATLDYARERGVDVWSADPVSPVLPIGHSRLERGIRKALGEGGDYYAADLGSGDFLFGLFPEGVEHARARFPRLVIRRLEDSTIVASYVRQILPQFLADLEQGHVHPRRVQRVGEICVLSNDLVSAASIYEAASRAFPDNWQFPWMLAICRKMSGDSAGASAPLTRAGEILAQSGDAAAPARLHALFQEIQPGMSLRGLAGKSEPEERE